MAWRAGALIANMEFIQFHPTCLYHAEAKSFLISEAVRGEGGILLDAKRRRFMEQYHPQKELAPRDIVARAIDAEMKRMGSKCVFLDITHKPAQFLKSRFPSIYETCLRLRHRHHLATDSRCSRRALSMWRREDGSERRDQSARTLCHRRGGLHGSAWGQPSRQQFAARRTRARSSRVRKDRPAIASRASSLIFPSGAPGHVQDLDEFVVIYHNWDEIRRLMWDYVGIVRTDKRLQRAATRLAQSSCRNSGVLLELQGLDRAAGASQSGDGRLADR